MISLWHSKESDVEYQKNYGYRRAAPCARNCTYLISAAYLIAAWFLITAWNNISPWNVISAWWFYDLPVILKRIRRWVTNPVMDIGAQRPAPQSCTHLIPAARLIAAWFLITAWNHISPWNVISARFYDTPVDSGVQCPDEWLHRWMIRNSIHDHESNLYCVVFDGSYAVRKLRSESFCVVEVLFMYIFWFAFSPEFKQEILRRRVLIKIICN